MTNQEIKTLEKIIKGAANHWRLRILLLLQKESDLSLIDISDELNANFKTISEHTKKLLQAGLLIKRYKGTTVLHSVSNLGRKLLRAIQFLQ